MALITRAEVKTILRLTDNSRNQSITFTSMEYEKLDRKPNVVIAAVSNSTKISTGAGITLYTTADYYTTEQYDGYTYIRRIDTGSIADTGNVKVRYNYNDYDSDIDALLPLVQADIVNYLNNFFGDKNTQYSGPFTINSSGTINDTEGDFLAQGFEDGMDIYISNTYRNDGIVNISSATSDTLTISTADTLWNEESTAEYGGNTIYITRVKWPNSLKMAAAYMIWESLDRARTADLKSKRLGPSAVTYQDLVSGGYSQRVYNLLGKYKKINTR